MYASALTARVTEEEKADASGRERRYHKRRRFPKLRCLVLLGSKDSIFPFSQRSFRAATSIFLSSPCHVFVSGTQPDTEFRATPFIISVTTLHVVAFID